MFDVHIRHSPTCTRPAPRSWPVAGGIKSVCDGCDGFFVVWDSPLPEAPAAASTQPASAYRCREHPGEPVSWKGSGCPRCPTRKANKRKAIRPSDYYTEERDR